MHPLRFLRRIVPGGVFPVYHGLIAWLGAARYGFPSRRMIVVGVTGTDGKTTTAMMIARITLAAGKKVGLSSSAVFRLGEKEWPNETHMTMPGRWALPRLLHRMVEAGCHIAILEVSSEGLTQGRLTGIDVDAAVITNLTPEHIESHGGFAAYRKAKSILFFALNGTARKTFHGQRVPKVSVVNADDGQAEYFSSFPADIHAATTLASEVTMPNVEMYRAEHVRAANGGIELSVAGHDFTIHLPGEYNAANALQAIALCRSYGVSWEDCAKGLDDLKFIPGRGELVDSGKGWSVVIDYALTPAALKSLYTGLRKNGAQRLIAVFGAAGGGRDVWKRPELGKIAAEYCDRIILTTDDPYDEDPAAIAAGIEAGISDNARGKTETILDRCEAIRKAMSLAQAGDVIALTGMGSETSMMVKGKKVEWSDADTVRSLIKNV